MVEEQELHLSVSWKGYARDILKEVVYGYSRVREEKEQSWPEHVWV